MDGRKKLGFDSLLTYFYDARPLIGNGEFVQGLKEMIYLCIKEYPFLNRLLNNTMRIQKGIGFFGQFLTETHGFHSGSIHIKNYGFFPYVNAVRLLTIKENINVTSTLSRLQQLSILPSYKQELNIHKFNFKKVLNYRLNGFQKQDNYEDVHYLNIKEMNQMQKKELKQILKDVVEFHQYTQNIILKGY